MVYIKLDNPNKGISQPDIYQVLAYAVRYKINEVALLYPDTIQNYQNEATGFTIRDEFADQVDVRVTAWQLPVINREMFGGKDLMGQKINDLFDPFKEKLNERIHEVLCLHFGL